MTLVTSGKRDSQRSKAGEKADWRSERNHNNPHAWRRIAGLLCFIQQFDISATFLF